MDVNVNHLVSALRAQIAALSNDSAIWQARYLEEREKNAALMLRAGEGRADATEVDPTCGGGR